MTIDTAFILAVLFLQVSMNIIWLEIVLGKVVQQKERLESRVYYLEQLLKENDIKHC